MSDSLLRHALRANATFSALTGLAMLLFSGPLAEWMGLAHPLGLQIVGAGLLPFAAYLVRLASREVVPLGNAKLICLMDLGWVAGSLALVAAAPGLFAATGTVALMVVALIVLGFAVAQWIGIRGVSTASGVLRCQ